MASFGVNKSGRDDWREGKEAVRVSKRAKERQKGEENFHHQNDNV
jgi:hypothetical protein